MHAASVLLVCALLCGCSHALTLDHEDVPLVNGTQHFAVRLPLYVDPLQGYTFYASATSPFVGVSVSMSVYAGDARNTVEPTTMSRQVGATQTVVVDPQAVALVRAQGQTLYVNVSMSGVTELAESNTMLRVHYAIEEVIGVEGVDEEIELYAEPNDADPFMQRIVYCTFWGIATERVIEVEVEPLSRTRELWSDAMSSNGAASESGDAPSRGSGGHSAYHLSPVLEHVIESAVDEFRSNSFAPCAAAIVSQMHGVQSCHVGAHVAGFHSAERVWNEAFTSTFLHTEFLQCNYPDCVPSSYVPIETWLSCDSQCISGCYHGLMEHWIPSLLEHLSAEEWADSFVGTLCRNIFVLSSAHGLSFSRYACKHGLGHGLLTAFGDPWAANVWIDAHVPSGAEDASNGSWMAHASSLLDLDWQGADLDNVLEELCTMPPQYSELLEASHMWGHCARAAYEAVGMAFPQDCPSAYAMCATLDDMSEVSACRSRARSCAERTGVPDKCFEQFSSEMKIYKRDAGCSLWDTNTTDRHCDLFENIEASGSIGWAAVMDPTASASFSLEVNASSSGISEFVIAIDLNGWNGGARIDVR